MNSMPSTMTTETAEQQSDNKTKNHFRCGLIEQQFEDTEEQKQKYCTPVGTQSAADNKRIPSTPYAPRRERTRTENYVREADIWTPTRHRRNWETSGNSREDLSRHTEVSLHTIRKQSSNDNDGNLSTQHVVRELHFFGRDSIFNCHDTVECKSQNAHVTRRHHFKNE